MVSGPKRLPIALQLPLLALYPVSCLLTLAVAKIRHLFLLLVGFFTSVTKDGIRPVAVFLDSSLSAPFADQICLGESSAGSEWLSLSSGSEQGLQVQSVLFLPSLAKEAVILVASSVQEHVC